jgi:hypothetical protein
MGIGIVAIQTTQKKEPAGAPFTSASAHEGTSIDAAGKVILGQIVGAVGDPALLDRNAEVPVNASGRTVTFRDLASALQTILGVGVVTLIDKTTNLPRIALQTAVAGNNGTIVNNAGSIEVRDSTNTFRLKTALSTGDTEVSGTIKTGDGNLGDPPAQPWNLGEAIVVPGLTFNDTVFVEVCINGVQWNLATINLPA